MFSCTHWLRPRNSPPIPPHLGSYTRTLLPSQDRRHLFVTPLGLYRTPHPPPPQMKSRCIHDFSRREKRSRRESRDVRRQWRGDAAVAKFLAKISAEACLPPPVCPGPFVLTRLKRALSNTGKPVSTSREGHSNLYCNYCNILLGGLVSLSLRCK